MQPQQRPTATEAVGNYFINKWRARLADAGLQATCKQMKKQGIPPEIAAAILAPVRNRSAA